jgi:PAS domain S-box-containing protein
LEMRDYITTIGDKLGWPKGQEGTLAYWRERNLLVGYLIAFLVLPMAAFITALGYQIRESYYLTLVIEICALSWLVIVFISRGRISYFYRSVVVVAAVYLASIMTLYEWGPNSVAAAEFVAVCAFAAIMFGIKGAAVSTAMIALTLAVFGKLIASNSMAWGVEQMSMARYPGWCLWLLLWSSTTAFCTAIISTGLDRSITKEQRLRASLEDLVAQRTQSLQEANHHLKLENEQRQLTEEALSQSEERFREMAELLPGAIVETKADLKISYLNQYGLEFFGYHEAVIANHLNGLDLIHPEDRENARDRLTERLVDKPLTDTEYRVIKKDQTSAWVLLNASPLLKSGVFTGIRAIITDISKRKHIEKEREKLITELQAALAEIKELRGFLPICSRCKKIRNDEGYWQQIETYISDRTDAQFSHGICPECIAVIYPNMDIDDD